MPCFKPFLAAARIPFPSMVFGREQPEKRLVQRVWRFHYLPIISAIFAHDHYILHDSKSVDLLGPWVRIPPTPPHSAKRHMLLGSFLIPGSNLPALQGPGSGAWRPPCWCLLRIQVGVDVGGRAEIAVPQPFLNLLERHVAGQQRLALECPYGIITTNRKSPVGSRVLRFSV